MKSLKQDGNVNTTMSSQQLEHQLDSCDPLACVLFSQSPSVQLYFALRSRLETCSEPWLQEFVALDGLESLLNSLCCMTSPGMSGFSDAILQIDCLSCIRAVINVKVGMNALIYSPHGIEKLLKGVNLANILPRKHVFEILSVVCVYDTMGFTKLMNALEKYKVDNHQSHKFSFVVNELKLAETVPHKKSILTFINALLCSSVDATQRSRMRNELIGLGLLDVLSFLQREDSDEDLFIQLQLFQEKKHEDEICSNFESNIDLNSPQDLADIIQTQIFGGPKMVCFVNILQDLVAIETTKKEKSNSIWQLLEQHVYHVVHSPDDVDCLHNIDPVQRCSTLQAAIDVDAKTFQDFYSKRYDCSSMAVQEDFSSKLVRKDCERLSRVDSSCTKKRVSCADSGFIGCEEKFSPQAEKRLKNMQAAESENFIMHNSEYVVKYEKEEQDLFNDKKSVPSDNINREEVLRKQISKHLSVYDSISPTKAQKDLKTFSTCDTAQHGCFNNLNLRSQDSPSGGEEEKGNFNLNVLANNHSQLDSQPEEMKEEEDDKNDSEGSLVSCPSSVMRNLKWIKIDESLRDEFPHCVWLKKSIGASKLQPNFPQVEELFKETYSWKIAETPLLSSDTRLKLNLFLNRCDEEPIDLVKRLVRVDGPAFPLSFIKQMIDALPEHDEIKHLKFYNGNLLELGQAEQFVLHLSDVPDYITLLKGQLRRSELYSTASRLRSILTSMLESSRIILSHEGLAEIFSLILYVGNFLNNGQFNGYAGGFKLSSLARLADVKSNVAGCSLLHFMLNTVEGKDEKLLSFLNEISRLKNAASSSLADIKADFDKMNSQINIFVKHLATANPIIRNGFNNFLNDVKWKFTELQSLITELKIQSRRLASYFCESESFDLQACFQNLLNFCEDLQLCREEVKLMAKQKAVASKHTNMLNQQMKSKHLTEHFGLGAGACSSVMEEKRRLVDCVLTELNRANFKPNLRPLLKLNLIPCGANKVDAPFTKAESADNVPRTPDHEKNTMELSRISLVGTPMMNRPFSEMYDAELTIADKPKFATSSENDLLDGKLVRTQPKLKIPPVLAVDQKTPGRSKSHYRSRSDLADSNIHTKWIRYQDQLKQIKAPTATPESSIILATLNLEARGMQHYVRRQTEPMGLVAGPTVKLPCSVNTGLEDKKLERKSVFTTFFTRLSRRVLKPRNIDGVDNVGFADAGGGVKNDKRQNKMEKNSSKSSSLGKISGSEAGSSGQDSQQDKENLPTTAFDRQKKNPIRLSNRFRNKIIKS